MRYVRMPIEVESPEEYGYGNIRYNLSESSIVDQSLGGLGLSVPDLTLLYGEHRGSERLRALVVAETPRLSADDVLITRVRGGDLEAYGELFARHQESANRLARSLTRGADADDLVSDAFAKVLGALQNGSGPDLAFRAYLLTTVRRLHVDRIRAQAKATPTDDVAALDQGVPFSDTAVADFENSAAARAYGSLPERWQMVLWHLEVEGQKPAASEWCFRSRACWRGGPSSKTSAWRFRRSEPIST